MNQAPEQLARERLNHQSKACGCVTHYKQIISLGATTGIVLRELKPASCPTDYVFFVNKQPICLVKVKPEEEGVRFVMNEFRFEKYANATNNLKKFNTTIGKSPNTDGNRE